MLFYGTLLVVNFGIICSKGGSTTGEYSWRSEARLTPWVFYAGRETYTFLTTPSYVPRISGVKPKYLHTEV